MFSKYKCIEIENKNIWDNFLESSSNPQVLQSYSWGEIKHNFSWKPIRLGIYENEELKGVILLLKKTIPFSGGKSIFYAPRGPVINYSDSEILKSLIKGIIEINKYHKAIVLKIDPFILENDEHNKKILIDCGFIKTNEQIQPRCTFIVNLEKTPEEMLMSFEPKTRYNIKLAEKKGVKINRVEDEKGVSVFYNLLCETAKRDEFTIHTENYYQTIWKLLRNDNNKCEIFLASVEDKIISGVFLFIFKDTCWYMYGASNNSYRNYMPNQLIHWEIIKWVKSLGIKKYDLWGIPCNIQPEHPLWGVYRFKKGFGGENIKLIGCYDLPLKKFYYNILNKGLYIYRKAINLKTRKSLDNALEE